MSRQATAWAWSLPISDQCDLLVLLTLSNYANHRNESWPALARIARESRCSESSARRSLKALVEAGHLSIRKAVEPCGRQTTNVYTLNVTGEGVKMEPSPCQNDTPEGVKMTPLEPSKIESSKYNPLSPSARVPDEPRLAARADDMPKHVKPVKDWGQAIAGLRDDPIRLDGERIVLSEATRATWLERFDGDAECLDLALIEARGCIQPNARAHPLAVQVEKQLARIVRDRKDRDARYARTAGSRRGGQDGPRKPTVSEILEQRRLAAAGGVA